MSVTCMICHDECKQTAKIIRQCKCRYDVHAKCFNTWYKKKEACIICASWCSPAFYETPSFSQKMYYGIWVLARNLTFGNIIVYGFLGYSVYRNVKQYWGIDV